MARYLYISSKTEIQIVWLPSLCNPRPYSGPAQYQTAITKMINSNQPEEESGISPSIGLALLAGPMLPGAAWLFGLSAAPAQLLLLGITVCIGVLLSPHEVRLPRTEIRFAPRHIVIFWAILTLGLAGGLCVAAVSAAASFSDERRSRMDWLRIALVDVFSTCAAGMAYGAVFHFGEFSAGLDLPGPLLIPGEVLAASAAMMLAFFLSQLLNGWIFSVGEFRSVHDKPAPHLARMLAGHSITALSAIALFAAFRQFGYEFGLILVPMIVLGNIFFEVHVRRLSQKTREIIEASRLHLATVEALATAIDARDQVSVGHVRRTQIFAVGIGTAIGLNDGELNALRAGALLHDIGKLAVPEHILNKPGRLTSAELEKTKIHANVGASILGKVGFPYPVVPTVKHHHEHWDGSGYPDGLCGDRIPITARILAVADAYDALRGARPYRAAVSREDACNFLRSRAGAQFDPHIVNTFLRNLTQLEAEVDIHGFGYQAELDEIEKNGLQGTGPANYVEQIKRANQEVFSLYEMARDFGASLDLPKTLSLLTKKVGEFVPYDTCLVYLYDEESAVAEAIHVEGRNSEVLVGKRIKPGEGASGYVLKKRKPVENVDPSLDFAFSHSEICSHYVGMASVPLMAEDRLIGAISVFSGKLATYEEEHLRLLETICRIAADAISKSIRHAESEIHAMTDQLTGLPNARSLHVQFEKEAGRSKRAGNSMQVLMLDLDGFKAVNDTLGHKAGDTMLKEIGRIINSELRDYDFLARYGGDEFVALVPETDTADVIELCSRIEAAVEEYASAANGRSVPVGVSVGAASYPEQGESFEELLIAADKAMYRTKAFHRQRRARLVESPGKQGTAIGPSRETEFAADGPAGSQPSIPHFLKGGYDSDLIVEIDESHIVTLNTVS